MTLSKRLYFANHQIDQRLKAGLVGHWVGGGSGNTLFDSSGYRNHGNIYGATLDWRLGPKNDYAINFDGSVQYIQLTSSIVAGTDVTWSAWVKKSSSTIISILGKDAGGGAAGYWHFYSDSNLYVGVGNGATQVSWPWTSAAFDDIWKHLAMVKTGTTLEMFYDGVSQGTRTMTGLTNVDYIGYGSSSRFSGLIGEVRIYNRAISTPEVLLLSNRFPYDYPSLKDKSMLKNVLSSFKIPRHLFQISQ